MVEDWLMSDKENRLFEHLKSLKADKYIAIDQSCSLHERWADFLTEEQLKDGADVYALVQRALREVYHENLEGLRSHAETGPKWGNRDLVASLV